MTVTDMIFTALAWITVVGVPIATVLGVIYFAFRYLKKSPVEEVKLSKKPVKPPKPDKSRPSPLSELNVEFPEVNSVEETGWDVFEESKSVVTPGTRIYRTYRSIDQVNWAECDLALTERAACNYAHYIKANNPQEYVRCEDPDGLILFYE